MSIYKIILFLLTISSTYSYPSITITEFGQQKTKYVVWKKGGVSPTVNGNDIHLPHGGRFYIADKDGEDLSPDMFYSPNWLNSNIRYDIDLS